MGWYNPLQCHGFSQLAWCPRHQRSRRRPTLATLSTLSLALQVVPPAISANPKC